MRRVRRFLNRLVNTAIGRRDEERLRSEIEEHLALEEALQVVLKPGRIHGKPRALTPDYVANCVLP